jgi:hypothetical protein
MLKTKVSGLVTLKSKGPWLSKDTDKTVGLHSFDLVYRVHMGRGNRGQNGFIAQDA